MELRHSLLVLVFISSICSFLDISNVSPYKKKYILAFLMGGALIVGGILFPISLDVATYEGYMSTAVFFGDATIGDDAIDYGFLAIAKLVLLLGGDVYALYILVAFLTLTSYYFSITHYTEYYFSLWLFILARNYELLHISQIRQGLGIAVLLVSIQYILKEEPKKFFLGVIIAALIHKSLIIAVALYPLYKIRWNKKRLLMVLLMCSIFYITPIAQWLFIDFFSAMGVSFTKFEYYLAHTDYVQRVDTGIFITRSTMIIVAATCLYKWGYNKLHRLLLSMIVLGALFFSATSDFSTLAERGSSNLLVALSFVPLLFIPWAKKLREKIYVMITLNTVAILYFVKNFIEVSVYYR